jgi:hypothetical protein
MDAEIPGFVTPVHRALTEPILMGGAPRSIAIVNGTLAAVRHRPGWQARTRQLSRLQKCTDRRPSVRRG